MEDIAPQAMGMALPARGAASILRAMDSPDGAVSALPFAPRRLVAGLLFALASCSPPTEVPPVACETTPSPGGAVSASDTLVVVLRVDSLPARGQVLVRVDPLDEDGVVRFTRGVVPTAAAVGVALTTVGAFQGCAGEAPGGFLLRTARTPRGKIWLRASADRPLRVRVSAGGPAAPGGTAVPATTLVVAPGASGQARWGATGSAP